MNIEERYPNRRVHKYKLKSIEQADSFVEAYETSKMPSILTMLGKQKPPAPPKDYLIELTIESRNMKVMLIPSEFSDDEEYFEWVLQTDDCTEDNVIPLRFISLKDYFEKPVRTEYQPVLTESTTDLIATMCEQLSDLAGTVKELAESFVSDLNPDLDYEEDSEEYDKDDDWEVDTDE